MVDILPPQASQTQEEQWQHALTTGLPMTPDMVQARIGQMARYQPIVFIQRAEVPHPSHRDYSMIETMKRDAIEKQKTANVRMIVRQFAPPTMYSWAPPDLSASMPRMADLERPLRIRMPPLLR